MKDKEILLFPFDYSEYIRERDLAFDFDKYTPGKRVFNFYELLFYIQNDTSLDFQEREWIIQQFWNYKITEIAQQIVRL
jgi:CDP-glycerol glycerophosphotransferase (TagB/SpsB family)